jgi:acetyl esterase
MPEPVDKIIELNALGVPCTLYEPLDPAGVIMYVHGGGFALYDRDGHDSAARRLANRSGLRVLSVDYRLAPQHPFPAQLDDLAAVVRWLESEGSELAPSGSVFVQGDSAGANLAIVTALKHPGRFRALVMLYPFLDPTAGFASYHAFPGHRHQPADAAVYWQQYAGSAENLSHPDVAPLTSSDLDTLPPTLVLTAEVDMLRDEGEHLVGLLDKAGVPVVGARILGVEHSFWKDLAVSPTLEMVTRQLADFYRQHVGQE